MYYLILMPSLFICVFSDQTTGWYNDAVWNNGGNVVLSSSSNSGSRWFNGGAWKNNRNWITGGLWNINKIWNASASGITYNFLSNMSNWNSLRGSFNVSYSSITSCTAWASFKSTFNKTYNNNQTKELVRWISS